MLDFEKFGDREFNELKTTIQKSVEKSDLDRYFLFSTDKFIKAKLFVLCYRFLLNAWNLTMEGELKKELKAEIDLVFPLYENISYFMNFIESGRKYGKHLINEKLFYEVNKQEVSDLIDVFAILTERVNIISISRFKGVIMEGKSGDEFNKIMKSDEKKRYSDEEMLEEEEILAPLEEKKDKEVEEMEQDQVMEEKPTDEIIEEAVDEEETEEETDEEETIKEETIDEEE